MTVVTGTASLLRKALGGSVERLRLGSKLGLTPLKLDFRHQLGTYLEDTFWYLRSLITLTAAVPGNNIFLDYKQGSKAVNSNLCLDGWRDQSVS